MSTSDIKINKRKNIVTKTIRPEFLEYGLVEREAYWLRKLYAESDRFPEVVFAKGNVIQTRYIGDRLEGNNVPFDWFGQMSEILEVMSYIGVRHNDIKPHDILVRDDRLYLIDFGWATPLLEAIPESWPEGIGGIFRSPKDKPEDRLSFVKSVEYVMRYEKYEKGDLKPLPL